MKSAVELIAAKRDGKELRAQDVHWLVRSYVNGDIAHEQMSAFLMAVVLKGMSTSETVALTQAYVESGTRLDFSTCARPTTDKHSTGGVGDKITLVLTPMIMALGGAVPQLSGRGLGHTGGTLDKLEAIAGYRSTLSADTMLKQLNEVGGFICAASDDLAPADRLIYALRDITATVESIPLIAASIMSKKIAEGTGALVLDVKVGNGAFMKDADNARALAREMINLGVASGVRTRAVLTDMSQPLGMSAGNALEVAEALEVLRGRGPADVRELSVVLAEEMLQAAGLPWDNTERVLDNGEALAAFHDLVASQGGDVTKGLPQANLREVVMVQQDGYIHSMNAMNVGIAAWRLGAGRARKEDLVDHSAGVVWKHKVGDAVRRGDVLFELHANDPIRMQAGLEAVIDAVVIDENPCDAPDLVLERVG